MDCGTNKIKLFQWDVNCFVSVPSGILYVDYNTNPVQRVEVSGGKARIPDELLERPGSLYMWFCIDDKTRQLHTIDVEARPIPPDHATTPTETVTFATLVEKVDGLVQSAGEDVERLVAETKREVNTFTDEKSYEIYIFENLAEKKIDENLQKVNTAILNADKAATSANTAASDVTQAASKAEQASNAAIAAATSADNAAIDARNATEQAGNVNISSQRTSSGAVVTTTDRNGHQTTVEIHDGDPGEPGHDIYIENPYDDTEIRNDLDAKMQRVVLYLTYVSNVYHLRDENGTEITFEQLYSLIRNESNYVVILYGNSKLRPQYVSTNEIHADGEDRDSQGTIFLRMIMTPSALYCGSFRLADKADIKVQDVKIDGESKVVNGVANIPVATGSSLGVVLGESAYSYGVTSAGQLQAITRSKEEYEAMSNNSFVGKGTLDNLLWYKFTVLTYDQYQALPTKDPNVFYFILE